LYLVDENQTMPEFEGDLADRYKYKQN